MSRSPRTARPARSARAMFTSAVLLTEAFVVLFAGLVAYGLDLVPTGAIAVGGGALVLCSIVAAGLLRRGAAGYVLGSIFQVLLIATGLVVPMMFAVGGLFALLWLVSLRIGGQIDVERVVREREQREYDTRQVAETP